MKSGGVDSECGGFDPHKMEELIQTVDIVVKYHQPKAGLKEILFL